MKPTDTALHLPVGHPPVKTGRIGVLLVNLGTPDGTDFRPMRRYLRGVPVRHARHRAATRDLVSDPLRRRADHAAEEIGRELRQDLERGAGRIAAAHHHARAGREAGRGARRRAAGHRSTGRMRYGKPSIGERGRAAASMQGCDRILSCRSIRNIRATTTATANDQLFRALMKMRWQPTVRSVPPYYDEPVYIEALARVARTGIWRARFRAGGGARLVSRHAEALLREGRPVSLPLPEDDAAAARAAGLGRAARLITTFQSRFGAQEWLKPYTDKTVETLAKEGVKRDRRGQSRLLGRLHRDAGGDRRRGRRNLPAQLAARSSPIFPASTTATRAWR